MKQRNYIYIILHTCIYPTLHALLEGETELLDFILQLMQYCQSNLLSSSTYWLLYCLIKPYNPIYWILLKYKTGALIHFRVLTESYSNHRPYCVHIEI